MSINVPYVPSPKLASQISKLKLTASISFVFDGVKNIVNS